MEPFPSRPPQPSALRWETGAHSGPDVAFEEMPNHEFGARKVVTGLSRSSVSSSASSSSSSLSSDNDDLFSLSTFGSPATSIEYGSSPAVSYNSPLAILKGGAIEQQQQHQARATDVLSLLFPDVTKAPADIQTGVHTHLAQGTIVSLPDARTLYTLPSTAAFDRDAVCDLLDFAEDHGCTGVVLPLQKGEEGLGEKLHELMYVGGVVLNGVGGDDWVLVGLDV